MKLEYFFIGFFALISLFILVFYIINSVKINKKQKKVLENKKTEEKNKEEKSKDEKIEVPAEQSVEKPVERAIKEANIEFQIKEAFERIEQERVEYENAPKNRAIGGKLQLDRGEFKTELQKSLETNKISSETNTISSSTAKMDFEMKDFKTDEQVDVEKQIAEEYMKKQENQNKTLGDELKEMSPELKAIMLNDILNKKY